LNWLRTYSKVIGTIVLFCGILFTAFLLRIQDAPVVPEGHFTSNDAYFYYWQAQLVLEHGELPARDMYRWLPFGRDLSQTLNLYGYALAYTHKVLAWVFPNVLLYHVVLYMPIVCFCIGLGALCLFLYRTFELLFLSVVGVLLATLPGSINRSVVGFGDRDAWCLMLGILAITTYLAALQIQKKHQSLLWTLASGFFVFLGGMSWEGFGVFLVVVLVVEYWRFLTSEKEEQLGLYTIWVLIFVPTLYLASDAYRNGYGLAKHLFAFLLFPPLALLGIRAFRCFLLSKVDKLRPHARTLSLSLTLVSAMLTLSYVWGQFDTFNTTTVPFSQSQLMQSVDELKPPTYNYWVVLYGNTFALASFGLIIAVRYYWGKSGSVFVIPLCLFTLNILYREFLDSLWGTSFSNLLFIFTLVSIAMIWLWRAWRMKSEQTVEIPIPFIAFAAWFIFWGSLARDANRYEFFVGVSIAFFTAAIIQLLCNTLREKLIGHLILQKIATVFITITTITLLMFWTPAGAYMNRSILDTRHTRQSLPADPSIAKTYRWIKSELPQTAVIAADWVYGSQLNVLAGVKTITDQDHYIPYWIYLYNQHVRFARSEREALEFLKTHNATHILLTKKDTKSFLPKLISDTFVPVYPTQNFIESSIKLWKIDYPSDIKKNPKYLETEPPEGY